MKTYWIPVTLRLAAGAKPTERNHDFMWGWWQCEGGNGGPMRNLQSARFNWLCTKRRMPGSTNFNTVGVQNYPNWAVGVAATVASIRGAHYMGLRSALKSGDPFDIIHRQAVRNSLSWWSHGNITLDGLDYADRVLEIGANLA